MRQGNDTGTQYRSAIYTTTEAQAKAAAESKILYQKALTEHGRGQITTEIGPAREFYFAESYHQQYLAKNPAGYCGLAAAASLAPSASESEQSPDNVPRGDARPYMKTLN